MAIVNLKDVKVYATFSRGFRVVEESTKGGKTYTQRYTIWSEGIGVAEGDIISLSGFLSAKVSEWTDKDQQVRHSVELSLNSPRLVTSDDQSAQELPSNRQSDPWDSEPSMGEWQTTDIPVDDVENTPF
jgi:hypothetical protein